MNLLITGGAGFIGSSFVRTALRKGDNVAILDALTYAGNQENLAGISDPYKFIKGNICDQELVLDILRSESIDAIINFAAESHVDNSIKGSSVFIDTNIKGTYSMLEAARKYYNELDSVKKNQFRFIHISTDEVYGDLDLNEDRKFDEKTAYKPSSPYSASKAASDLLAIAWHRTYCLPVIVTNCSNNYGPRQFPEKLIPHMILCALSGKSLPLYGDGKNIRDWIHVEDHCNGIYLALVHGKIGQTYCFGGNSERSNLELVNYLCELLDELSPKKSGSYKEQLTFIKDRSGHDRRYAIDDSKAILELGFKRKYNFEQGLKDTVQWYLTNSKWFTTYVGKQTSAKETIVSKEKI